MRKNFIVILLAAGSFFANAQELSRNALGQKITHASKIETPSVSKTADPVIWEQKVSTADNKYAIVSTYYTASGWGLYSADDFKAENDITINAILFNGSQSNDEAQERIRKVHIYFYEDDGGKPAGSPETQGSEFRKLSFDYSDLTVEPGVDAFLGNKIYHLNIKEVIGKGINLPAGTYWVSIVFDIEMASSDFNDRFSWADSENAHLSQPKAISSELGIPEWKNVPDIGFPVKAFAFTFYGEGGILSTESADFKNLKIYPSLATDYFYISGSNVGRIKDVSATNAVGQRISLQYTEGKVDVSHLTKGLYIVRIETTNGTVTKKLIKK